ncbi:hypothetical protein BDN71DRAFT_534762 [Pleurotus eryngii]|uniref:Uncharacterized protein n=1 Tax=Pleurotus eryngii TaxID=5323 RepID=A0A9P6A0X4_PLEER|nr:hypothetical protein BDN71DRAFT_534762 [Pleurotus eryngii]
MIAGLAVSADGESRFFTLSSAASLCVLGEASGRVQNLQTSVMTRSRRDFELLRQPCPFLSFLRKRDNILNAHVCRTQTNKALNTIGLGIEVYSLISSQFWSGMPLALSSSKLRLLISYDGGKNVELQ